MQTSFRDRFGPTVVPITEGASRTAILSPESGAVKGAEVTSRVVLKPWAPERSSSPAGVVETSNRAALVDDEDDEYRPTVWAELERIVGYRVTDENQMQAFHEANRSPVEQLYAEVVAARQVEPRVIVRPGIGHVLGVR